LNAHGRGPEETLQATLKLQKLGAVLLVPYAVADSREPVAVVAK
jgi:hypothetical protein